MLINEDFKGIFYLILAFILGLERSLFRTIMEA